MWINNLWDWILKKFGKTKTTTTDRELKKNSNYVADYVDTTKINFGALFSNRLATLATSDSNFVMEESNKRSELLNFFGLEVWNKIKKIVAGALGTGGMLVVPYVKNGKLYFDLATQDRLNINAKDGEKITDATVLADTVTINNTLYYRFVNYTIINGTLTITSKTVTSYGKDAHVEQWENISDISIQNVDRVPFGYLKCPVDNRYCSDDYGVPITYGCDSTIEKIHTCLEQIEEEFELKEVKLRVDERDLDKDEKGKPILKSKLFLKTYNVANENIFDIFDPAIRDSSFYNRLMILFATLEKEVGTSKGILTEPSSTYENVEAIKAANRDTWAIITDIRKNIQQLFEDLLYTCDVFANYYNLSPSGEYSFKFDWDYSLIESSTNTWANLKDLQSMGAMSKAELRAWSTGETIEEAEKKVEEIKKKEPSLRDLVGVE